jgi:hypothetical protein
MKPVFVVLGGIVAIALGFFIGTIIRYGPAVAFGQPSQVSIETNSYGNIQGATATVKGLFGTKTCRTFLNATTGSSTTTCD